MKPLITKTKRLIIRPLDKKDFTKWKESNSNMSLSKNKWDSGRLPNSEVTTKEFNKVLSSEKKQRLQDDFYNLYVFEKKTGDIVGQVSAMEVVRRITHSAFLGYKINNNHWGKGYGKESVLGMIHFSFKTLKLHRLEAGIEPTNKRSIYLAKSLNLRKEGFKKRIVFLRDQWVDLTMYSITCEELGYKWKQSKKS